MHKQHKHLEFKFLRIQDGLKTKFSFLVTCALCIGLFEDISSQILQLYMLSFYKISFMRSHIC